MVGSPIPEPHRCNSVTRPAHKVVSGIEDCGIDMNVACSSATFDLGCRDRDSRRPGGEARGADAGQNPEHSSARIGAAPEVRPLRRFIAERARGRSPRSHCPFRASIATSSSVRTLLPWRHSSRAVALAPSSRVSWTAIPRRSMRPRSSRQAVRPRHAQLPSRSTTPRLAEGSDTDFESGSTSAARGVKLSRRWGA